MMGVTQELQDLGVIRKAVDSEVDPSKPTYWSRHAWSFGDNNDGVVQLRLLKMRQNGREILHGSMSLGAIDALAGVPAFHPGITNEEAANLAMDEDSFNTYQRALIAERIPGIKDAWRESGFCHTGTVSLHVPPEHLASGAIDAEHCDDGSVVLRINLKDILIPQDDEYTDVDQHGRDHRPLHVVDGQHRKVSCELDLFLQGFNVFVNVLPLGTTYAEAAQLFTELNVTAEPLKPLHQLFQRYTCFIPHREAGKDFGDPNDADIPEGRHRYRRANRRAFFLAMQLAARPNPLYRRVQTMELPNRQLARGCAVTSKKFLSFARSWFLSSALFEGTSEAEAFTTFKTYLRAWQWVTNRDADEKVTDEEGWRLTHTRATTDPYITRPLPFESVLMLFPLIHGYSKLHEGTLVERYKAVLKPLLPVDFTDFEALKSGYGLDKETPLALYAWFSWAISNHAQTGQTYPAEVVWNPVNPDPALCKPGRGFFSPPDSASIGGVVEWGDDGLAAGTKVKVWMRPYPNIHRKPFASVKYLDDQGVVLASASDVASMATDHGYALFTHLAPPAIEKATKLQVQLLVRRLGGEGTVQTTFSIKDLSELEDHEVAFGKDHGIPDHWLLSPERDGEPETGTPMDGTPSANDGEAAPVEVKAATPLTVVQVDDVFMMPPPKPNTSHAPREGRPIVPRSAQMVGCPRCSSGMDCNNANCIGKSVRGYEWI